MAKIRRPRVWGALLLILLAAALCGCRTLGYYKQAAQGQVQIWRSQKPITVLLNDPATPPALKEKLKLVRRLREFAEMDLRLPVNDHYLKYADLGRRYVVWNVYAAPELSLEPKRWWYPFVGRLKYRGFFIEKLARDAGARLAKDGYDVHVGGVEAYSTLGWFRDPVLNTFIHHEEADLAEILFHELAHQRVFASGDTDFNEAFATAVAEVGVKRWLSVGTDTNAVKRYEQQLDREEQFIQLVMDARDQLEIVYARLEEAPEPKDPLTRNAARQEKAAVINRLRQNYAQIKEQWEGDTTYDPWFARPINNARLNTLEAYHHFVPAFRRLLDNHGGNFEKFYEAVQKLTRLSKEKRHEVLEQLLPPGDRKPETESKDR